MSHWSISFKSLYGMTRSGKGPTGEKKNEVRTPVCLIRGGRLTFWARRLSLREKGKHKSDAMSDILPFKILRLCQLFMSYTTPHHTTPHHTTPHHTTPHHTTPHHTAPHRTTPHHTTPHHTTPHHTTPHRTTKLCRS